MNILFDGWIHIPHSYAIVNCFQLVHLKQKYGDTINMYVREPPYFSEGWKKQPLIYSDEYNNIINNMKQWSGEHLDLIYTITYPYNIHAEPVPKCVFYTAEYAKLDNSYFVPNNVSIPEYLKSNPQIHFTSPSVWSSNGMRTYGVKNRIITHGVDATIFKPLQTNDIFYNNFRQNRNLFDSDVLLLHVSSSYGSGKGTHLVIAAMHILVNILKRTEYKLILKGVGDLYNLKWYIDQNLSNIVITTEQLQNIFTNHIFFISETVSFKTMNDLYNIADLCLSPYICEGFNLTPLEALATGTSVLVPRTGSTKEYIENIGQNGGNEYIHYVDSTIVDVEKGQQNEINIDDLVNVILNYEKRELESDKMIEYIKKEYSWFRVADLLYDYFLECAR
jgi:glycosyltransferase involved in cell wall biosynthesis